MDKPMFNAWRTEERDGSSRVNVPVEALSIGQLRAWAKLPGCTEWSRPRVLAARDLLARRTRAERKLRRIETHAKRRGLLVLSDIIRDLRLEVPAGIGVDPWKVQHMLEKEQAYRQRAGLWRGGMRDKYRQRAYVYGRAALALRELLATYGVSA